MVTDYPLRTGKVDTSRMVLAGLTDQFLITELVFTVLTILYSAGRVEETSAKHELQKRTHTHNAAL